LKVKCRSGRLKCRPRRSPVQSEPGRAPPPAAEGPRFAVAQLREPLKGEHIKHRLLGHWDSDPCTSLTYIHLNRLIKEYDLNAIFLAGPGHGAPALLSNVYLEGTYSEIYSDVSEDFAWR
jgi:hypothetical protein